MERMDDREPRKSGDTRRELQRSMAREKAGLGGGRSLLNTIMLGILIALAAVASYAGMTFSIGTLKSLTTLSVFLYIITAMVYRNRYERGKMRGRLDGEYMEAVRLYREERDKVYDRGMAGDAPAFCRAYKVRELREYRANLLADVDMDYEEYRAKYMRMTLWEVWRLKLPWAVKQVIIKCNTAKPLRLTPGMMLNENGEANRQELLRQSGRERERSDKRKQLIERAVYVLFGGAAIISIALDFSPEIVMRWAVRMMPIMMAVITGDDAGFVCMTVTEVNFKRDQVTVLRLFEEQGASEEPAPMAEAVSEE